MTSKKKKDISRVPFSVWAPLARKVNLHLIRPRNEVIPMKKDSRGYFTRFVEGDMDGMRYFFSVDGSKDMPDPASHFQPDGVTGASQKVDHGAFPWTDESWRGLEMRDLIIYELHVGTFTREGTFDAIIPRLQDLVDLGINAIEVMPISQFPGSRNWGYDGVFPYAVQNSYGGPDAFKRFINACHLAGIAVILDVVYNHFGPEGNVFPNFGPYLTDAYQVPWGQAINYDQQYSDGVRDFVVNNTKHWFVNYHVDGLRLDAIHAIHDLNGVHILREINEHREHFRKQTGRRVFTIAESDLNDAKVVRHTSVGGYDFDAQWLDDFHHALYVLIHPPGRELYVDFGRIEQLAKAYTHGFVFTGEYVSFRKRSFGTPSDDVQPDRFVVFNQNHDQIGNRVHGERLSDEVGIKSVKLAAAALIFSPYIPMLFMGEEYLDPAPFLFFVSHSDPKLTEAVREGRKKEFAEFHHGQEPPDPSDSKNFEKCILDWGLRKKQKHADVLDWYKSLIALRKEHPAFVNTRKNCFRASIIHPQALLLVREDIDAANRICCVLNFSNKAVSVNVPDGKWEPFRSPEKLERRTRSGGKSLISGRISVSGITAAIYLSQTT